MAIGSKAKVDLMRVVSHYLRISFYWQQTENRLEEKQGVLAVAFAATVAT